VPGVGILLTTGLYRDVELAQRDDLFVWIDVLDDQVACLAREIEVLDRAAGAGADSNHFTGDGIMVGRLLNAVLTCEDGALDRFAEALPLCAAQKLDPIRMIMHTSEPARRLSWDACYNVRDLGGYATSDGTQTRWRSFVRADTMCRLTVDGRTALLDYGVRTVLDLRRSDELRLDPNPFAAPPGQTSLVTYLNLPLGAGASIHERAAVKAASGTTLEGLFCTVLDNYWRGIAAILAAIASAPEGGVLFHCHAGKDRTGIVAALLLTLAGVSYPTIAEDYALSAVCLQPIYDEQLRQEPDPARREWMATWMATTPETMLAILAHLDAKHGGAEAYLLASGVTGEKVERIRQRLRG
jgi:protein-tyrosine phosphatase